MMRTAVDSLQRCLQKHCPQSAVVTVHRGAQQSEERVNLGDTVWYATTETRNRDTVRWAFEFGTYVDQEAVVQCRLVAADPANTKLDTRDSPVLSRPLIALTEGSNRRLFIALSESKQSPATSGDQALLSAFQMPSSEVGAVSRILFYDELTACSDLRGWLHYLRGRNDQLAARKKQRSSPS